MDFSNINWLAVIVATVSTFVFGFIWYGPLFAKAWMKEVGITREDARKANMLMIFGPAFILTFIMGFMLAMHINSSSTWLSGLELGAMLGCGFIAPTTGVNYLFSRKSLLLWFIDSGYSICVLMIMGAVLGAWH